MAVSAKKETVCSYLAAEDLKSVFRFLTGTEIEELCAYLEIKEYQPESVVMTEGELGEFMGFLVKGKLAVKKETLFPGKYVLLAILEPGTMVGEISAMENSRRNATVTVLEKSQILILTRPELDKLIEENPALGVKFLRRIIQVLSLRLRRADDRLSRLL